MKRRPPLLFPFLESSDESGLCPTRCSIPSSALLPLALAGILALAIGFLLTGRTAVLTTAPDCALGKPLVTDRTLHAANGLVCGLGELGQHALQLLLVPIAHSTDLACMGQPVLEVAAFGQIQIQANLDGPFSVPSIS